jgi:macrolide transport system ATP-binding/permease protein
MSSSPSLSSAHAPRPGALVARDLAKAYADRVVLDGVDLVAGPGRPLGLVGENGSGKSTLLRLLAGVEAPDAGEVVRPAELGYLPQEPDFEPDATLGDVLDAALRPLHRGADRLADLAGRLTDPAAADEYAALLDWCELHDVWGADRRARDAADRLGLGRLAPETAVRRLSGGQRSRLALAALVARRPSCLLLDEPTNHLDDAGVSLLEEFVVDLPGVVVVASHDRVLLERVCRQVVDLDPSHFGTDGAGGNRFTGGYADYLTEKRRARQRWRVAFVEQQEELAALRVQERGTARRIAPNRPPRDNDKFIHHSKGENIARTVSRRVRDVEQRIARLQADRVPKPPRELSFSAVLAHADGAGPVASVRDLVVPGRVSVPRLDVAAGEHLLVTGANGSGKSTLLKVLAGVLAPGSGQVDVGARRTGYLPQDVTFARPDLSAVQVYAGLVAAGGPGSGGGSDAGGGAAAAGGPVAGRRGSAPDREDAGRALHDLGLLPPREARRPVGQLSLGQQRRLALAVLVAQAPDLLLLDEPTNHISLALAEELEESLRRSPGTVVVASHDRWLRGRWDGRLLPL